MPLQDASDATAAFAVRAADPPDWGRSFVDRLTEEERRAFAENTRREQHPANSLIFREGDPGDSLFIVETGRIAVLKHESSGQDTLLAYRGPGEILGEIGVVGQRSRTASVMAVEDCNVIRIDGNDFRLLVADYPGIGRAIMDVLIGRVEAADVARTSMLHEEQQLADRLAEATTEAGQLAELARLRQDTVDLIVHDLRNPLGIIQSCLEMLRIYLPEDVLATSTVLRVFDLAQNNCNRLTSLIESLLEAARQENTGISLKLERIDLPLLLQTGATNVRAYAEKNNVSIKFGFSLDLPSPQGDFAQLERVIVNLLDNALTYTPSGGSVVLAAVKRAGSVQVSVTDTGPGVPPEYRQHIFERFGRVPGVQGRRRGFGLGLYFCRQVAEAHGGRIWVEPGPDDKGSRFVFTLPVD